MDQVRYAIVGAGWIAREAFLPGVAKTGNSRVTAIVSGSPERAGDMAAAYDIDHLFGYDRFEDLLASGVIDAVYIALPNSLHADYALRALQAGKHVLVEKPLAISEDECRALMVAAAASGANLMTAYRLHNDACTIDVIERVRAGEIGDPKVFSGIFTTVIGDDNHRLSAEHWGGPLQDIGIYCINMARHVFGAEPIAVTALTSSGEGDARFGEVPESLSAVLQFPKGRIAQFVVSFNAGDRDAYEVTGTRGSLLVDPGFRFETLNRLILRRNGDSERIDYPPADHFAGMISYFSDCILNGTRPETGLAEGLADVRIMRAIEHAAATGQVQALPPFNVDGAISRNMVRTLA